MKKKIKKIEELEKVVEKVFNTLSKNLKNNSATVISLAGDLGSGKTTFAQNAGKVLKIKEKINSPTFVISKKYNINNKKFP